MGRGGGGGEGYKMNLSQKPRVLSADTLFFQKFCFSLFDVSTTEMSIFIICDSVGVLF